MREWDVGKKENLDREKGNKDADRRDRRERSRDRSRERNRDRSRDRNISRNRDNERSDRDKDRRQRREKDVRSSSLSPSKFNNVFLNNKTIVFKLYVIIILVRKQKKKEDPPLRLLDDLFRKTKATPCIYWLPLTPEQVSKNI